MPKLRPRPTLADTNPARAMLIILSFTIPRELNFDTSPFITIDFFISRTNYMGHLRAINNWSWLRFRSPLCGIWNEFNTVLIAVAFFTGFFFGL